MFGFGNSGTNDATEASGEVPVRRGGLIAFLKRRINPLAADREEKYVRLEARVASGVATGEQFNQLGDMKLEKGLRDDALDLYKSACDQFLDEDLVVKSIAVIKKILKQFPDDVCATEMYVRLGDLNQRRGMVANAKEAYLAAAQRYQEKGAVRDALTVFQRLADLLPDNVELNADLGRMYAKEGMKEEASTQYGRTAQRLIEMGDLRRARELCLASLGQRAGNRDALHGLLHIASVEEDYSEADAYMGRLSDYVESDWELLKAYGDLLAQQGRREEAIAQYQKASALNPMNQELEAALRTVSGGAEPPLAPQVLEGGDEEPVVATEEDAPPAAVIEIDDEVLEGFDPTALGVETGGETGEEPIPAEEPPVVASRPDGSPSGREDDSASVALEDYTAIFDQDTASEAEVAHVRAEETADAPIEVEAAPAEPPPVAPPAIEAAEVERQVTEARFYEEIGMADEAAAAWQALLEVAPDHPQVEEAATRLGLRGEESAPEAPGTGGESGAAPVTHAGIPAAEAISEAEISDLLAEADIYVAGTLFDEAIAIYERILATSPDLPDAAVGLERARQLAGDTGLRQEEQRFEEGIERQMTDLLVSLVGEDDGSDEDPRLHLELANSYLEMGMVDEAMEEARVALQGASPPVPAYLVLGSCHVMRGEQEEAVEALEAYLQRCGESDEALEARYELALLHLERGANDKAAVQLEAIEAASPGYRDVAELLAGCAR